MMEYDGNYDLNNAKIGNILGKTNDDNGLGICLNDGDDD